MTAALSRDFPSIMSNWLAQHILHWQGLRRRTNKLVLDAAIDPYARPLADVTVSIADGNLIAADLHLQRKQREAVRERLAARAETPKSRRLCMTSSQPGDDIYAPGCRQPDAVAAS